MSIKTLMNDIRKTTGSTSFTDSKYGDINGYIDTGCYALNRLVSGSVRKGIPNGRVIIFAGESQTGKSYLSAQVASNALNKHKYDTIFYFDGEGGGLKSFFQGQGCDIDKVEHILVESIEDATVKILSVYAAINEEKKTNPNYNAVCIVDSLGALVSNKFMNDANEKGKQVSDMGSTAKLINSLVKGCTIPALKSNVSILFINHIYEDPMAMYPTKIKQQAGGLRLQYMSSITIQCTRSLEKDEAKDSETTYKGTKLKFFIVKNRLVKPFYESEMYIDFSKGVTKYDGLIEPAIKYGFIIAKGAWYQVPSFSDKNLRMDDILTNDAIWDSFLDKFDEMSIKDMSYSSAAEIDVINADEPVVDEAEAKK